MIKFIKKIYFKIICYGPIIEELYNYDDKNISKSSNYVASPIIINRKIKRNCKRKLIENNE